MLITEFLAHRLGVRLMRESMLKASGFYTRRDASRDINQKFRKGLAAIEKFNGTSLSPQARRQADDYAHEILGNLDYAPSLHFYAAMQGRFREGWIPENFYHLVVVPNISKGFFEISSKKSLSNMLMRTEALPDIAYHIGGSFYDRDYRPISRAALIELARPHGAVFVKGDDSGRGESVRKVPVAALADHPFTGDSVIQRPIRQHEFFDAFMTGSVATIRITTLRTPSGAIEMRGSALRLGRTGMEWLVSGQNVSVIVRDEAGTLNEFGYTGDWRAWAAHPDSGTVFAGHRIPSFAKALALCKELHARLPHVVIIGWDVAINRDGEVEVIEWNAGHCGISVLEALTGPHFTDMGWERFAKVAPK
jgi:Sugar-transfer associated ATP-grasp